MSTILKALRRLERDKTPTGQRPLREEVAISPASADRPRRRRLPLAVALTVLVAAGAGYGLWRLGPWQAAPSPAARDVAAEPAAAPAPKRAAMKPGWRPRNRPVPAASRSARAAAAAHRTEAAATQQGLPDEAFASNVEVVKRPAPSPRVPIEIAHAADPLPAAADAGGPPGSGGRAPEATRAPRPTPKPAATGLANAAPARAPAPIAVARASAPAATPGTARAPVPSEPTPAATRAPASSEPTPAVAKAPASSRPARTTAGESRPRAATTASEIASRTGSTAPAHASAAGTSASQLRVEKTLWHPDPGRRAAFVSLDGKSAKRFQEGDVVGRYVVSEIQPDGVVFLEDGKTVRRKVGE